MALLNGPATKILVRLLKDTKKYWYAAILGLVGVIIVGLSDAFLIKYVSSKLLDYGLIAREPRFLALIPYIIIATFVVRGLGEFIRMYFMGLIGRNTVRDYRCRMLKHMMLLPASFYDKKDSGTLVSKINYDTEQVAITLGEGISDAIRGAAIAIAALYVMFSTSWRLTMILLGTVPFLTFYLMIISRKMRYHSSQMQLSMGDVTTIAGEVIEGNKIVKAFNGYAYENARVLKIAELNKKKAMRLCFVSAVSSPIMQFIGALSMSAFVILAIKLIPDITPGEFASMLIAISAMLRPIKQITASNTTIQRGIAAAQSIFNLLDEAIEVDTGTYEMPRVKGKILFHQVAFDYNPNKKIEEMLLHNISLAIEPGTVVALVGKSGGGKSTLVSLLPRFYNILAGNIFLDGMDIKNITLSSLRAQFAVVSQHVYLFNDTIANNIAYGALNKVSRTEIIEAARAAHALEFIDKLPDGLETRIGQNGILLSGGQRQRIAIARAILKDAPVLILDEATSALDNESELYIQRALNNLMQGRTTIIIAHRLSTIEHADQIIVFEDGKIMEVGTHSELLHNKARYAALYTMKQAGAML